jgi:hypothetical protein
MVRGQNGSVSSLGVEGLELAELFAVVCWVVKRALKARRGHAVDALEG